MYLIGSKINPSYVDFKPNERFCDNHQFKPPNLDLNDYYITFLGSVLNNTDTINEIGEYKNTRNVIRLIRKGSALNREGDFNPKILKFKLDFNTKYCWRPVVAAKHLLSDQNLYRVKKALSAELTDDNKENKNQCEQIKIIKSANSILHPQTYSLFLERNEEFKGLSDIKDADSTKRNGGEKKKRETLKNVLLLVRKSLPDRKAKMFLKEMVNNRDFAQSMYQIYQGVEKISNTMKNWEEAKSKKYEFNVFPPLFETYVADTEERLK